MDGVEEVGVLSGESVATGQVESLLRVTVRFAWAILLSMVAGLVLQLWVVRFIGSLGPRALYVQSI